MAQRALIVLLSAAILQSVEAHGGTPERGVLTPVHEAAAKPHQAHNKAVHHVDQLIRRDLKEHPGTAELELAVLKHAALLQCPNATVPMPCGTPQDQPIFHFHMAKMAGYTSFLSTLT